MKKFFTNNKIIAGVIGLIAIVSLVNTQAIIKLSSRGLSDADQSAQVLSAGSNCLQIDSPLGTRVSNSFDGEIENQNYKVEEYLIGVSIKNICSQKIYIVNPSTFWSQSATLTNPLTAGGVNAVYGDIISEPSTTNNFMIGISSFPGITTYTNPIPSQFLSHTPPGLLGENMITEFVSPGPSDTVSLDFSQTQGLNLQSNLIAYGLNPRSSKKFWYFVSVVHPGYLDNPAQYLSFTKIALKRIKWFRENSLNDSILTNLELKTFNIPNNISKFLETSSVRIGDLNLIINDGKNSITTSIGSGKLSNTMNINLSQEPQWSHCSNGLYLYTSNDQEIGPIGIMTTPGTTNYVWQNTQFRFNTCGTGVGQIPISVPSGQYKICLKETNTETGLENNFYCGSVLSLN